MHFAGALISAVVAATYLGVGTPARATALTPYYDQASWQAATAELQIGPFKGVASETYTTTTVENLPPFGYPSVIDMNSTTFPTGFGGVFGDFSFAAFCEFDFFCVITNATDISIAFDQPILGFAALSFTRSDVMTVNGIAMPTDGGPQFFGLVGPISTLDFMAADDFTDNDETLDIENIVVATLPEPMALPVFAAGLSGLAIMRRRRNAIFAKPKFS
jgi:hypothetical protein